MGRRRLGVAAAGVGVAAAVGDRLLRSAAGELEPALDAPERRRRWRDVEVAYAEAGDPDDPDLVCLHGINAAASRGEFRGVFDALAETHHVIAPDLPGFGRSDRPPLRYSAPFYEDFVADFLASFDSPVVLASSLSGAYAARALTDGGVDAAALLAVCPTAVAGPDPPKTWLRELLRTPVVGSAAVDALVSKPSIRYFNADHAYGDPASVADDWIDYQWRTAHQHNARFAVASFVAGHCNAAIDLGTALRDVDAPVTLLWGRDATLPPLARGRDLAETADARLVVFDHAKLLPHVEYPAAFLDAVAAAT